MLLLNNETYLNDQTIYSTNVMDTVKTQLLVIEWYWTDTEQVSFWIDLWVDASEKTSLPIQTGQCDKSTHASLRWLQEVNGNRVEVLSNKFKKVKFCIWSLFVITIQLDSGQGPPSRFYPLPRFCLALQKKNYPYTASSLFLGVGGTDKENPSRLKWILPPFL